MSFTLVPKSATLNGLERRNGVALLYFSDFGKPAFQHITASICGIKSLCSACTMLSIRKFTFAVSSPDEFLVVTVLWLAPITTCVDQNHANKDGRTISSHNERRR